MEAAPDRLKELQDALFKMQLERQHRNKVSKDKLRASKQGLVPRSPEPSPKSVPGDHPGGFEDAETELNSGSETDEDDAVQEIDSPDLPSPHPSEFSPKVVDTETFAEEFNDLESDSGELVVRTPEPLSRRPPELISPRRAPNSEGVSSASFAVSSPPHARHLSVNPKFVTALRTELWSVFDHQEVESAGDVPSLLHLSLCAIRKLCNQKNALNEQCLLSNEETLGVRSQLFETARSLDISRRLLRQKELLDSTDGLQEQVSILESEADASHRVVRRLQEQLATISAEKNMLATQVDVLKASQVRQKEDFEDRLLEAQDKIASQTSALVSENQRLRATVAELEADLRIRSSHSVVANASSLQMELEEVRRRHAASLRVRDQKLTQLTQERDGAIQRSDLARQDFVRRLDRLKAEWDVEREHIMLAVQHPDRVGTEGAKKPSSDAEANVRPIRCMFSTVEQRSFVKEAIKS